MTKKKSNIPLVRRNLIMPESVAQRLEAIKKARALVSDSEAIRQMIGIMEIITGRSGTDLIQRDNVTGAETLVLRNK
jgi:hypothetical protein